MKLLSICIPTYNRVSFLKKSLERILPQFVGCEGRVELLISDNASTDGTRALIEALIAGGAPIHYNRNDHNLGMDGNFIWCLDHAEGEYVWLLGDDDYLMDGMLGRLIDILDNGDYGLVHLKTTDNRSGWEAFTGKREFFGHVSYWVTFISSNIVRRKYLSTVDLAKYRGTFFVFLPVYFNAMIGATANVVVWFSVLDASNASHLNGGYNFFEVFVKNYLNIIKDYRRSFGCLWYEREKYKLFRYFVWSFCVRLITTPDHELRFETSGWVRLLISKYWYEPYLYPAFFLLFLKK